MKITVATAAAYLDRQLDRIAQDPEQDFPLFTREMTACLARVEAALSVAQRREVGAPCPECEAPAPRLVMHRVTTDLTGASDTWRCPVNRDHRFTEAEYRLRVSDDFLANSDRLTAPDMERQYRVPAGSVRGWASQTAVDGRARVRKRGRDDSGRQLYDVADVLAVRDGERKQQRTA
jgi:hypothetical protein